MKPELLARALVALLLAAPPALAQDPAPLPEALPVVEEPVVEDEDEEEEDKVGDLFSVRRSKVNTLLDGIDGAKASATFLSGDELMAWSDTEVRECRMRFGVFGEMSHACFCVLLCV